MAMKLKKKLEAFEEKPSTILKISKISSFHPKFRVTAMKINLLIFLNQKILLSKDVILLKITIVNKITYFR